MTRHKHIVTLRKTQARYPDGGLMGSVSGGAKEGEGYRHGSEKHFAVNKCQIAVGSPKSTFLGL